MEYWVIQNNEQTGPLSLEQLMSLGLKPDTPVWHIGLESWVPASELPVLEVYFATVSSEIVNDETSIAIDNTIVQEEEPKKPLRKCPPTYLVWSILATICCCTPLGIPAIVFAAQVKRRYNAGDYFAARKASERAALWLILSFVVGLIYQQFSALFSLL